MGFKDIHKLKKIDIVVKESIAVPYLVIGKDIFALSLYATLKKNHGSENVRLLSEAKILASDFLPKGPGHIRGETNQNIFKALYPDVTFEAGHANALFYKDMAWKSFGGRSKSEALKFNEEFYTGPRFDVDLAKIFPDLDNAETFLDLMNQEAYQVKIKNIKKQGEKFSVECINGTEFFCETLYFGQSPFQFLNLYEDKNSLNDSFIQFCESTKTPSALFVKFVFNKTLTEMKETLFIPLSYTHEWGHFVGEFKNKGLDLGFQEVEFMHFLDEDQSSEEDISRTIRLLKRNMEKIFEQFTKNEHREFISLEQEIGCLKIDDNLFRASCTSLKDILKNFTFIGINAPITDERRVQSIFEYSSEELNGITRGLVVHQLCEKNLHPIS